MQRNGVEYILSRVRARAHMHTTVPSAHRSFGICLCIWWFGWFVYFHQANDGLLISILQKICILTWYWLVAKAIHHRAWWFNDDSRPRMRCPLWSEVNIGFRITSTNETERERRNEVKWSEVRNLNMYTRRKNTHCNIYKQLKWFCIPIDSLRNQQTIYSCMCAIHCTPCTLCSSSPVISVHFIGVCVYVCCHFVCARTTVVLLLIVAVDEI